VVVGFVVLIFAVLAELIFADLALSATPCREAE
jgi:hypothetical protein